jgi:murein DD-endopeptidase MepM/ murein hydrolase activator NlpD
VSIHAGIDYGVPKGTVVTSCGPGKVVLARSRIVTGNSIVIEHLPGVYSLYYHLDKIEVAEGAIVATGTPLGLSGATGLATGPHLHWEIRVAGENSDPDAFVARPILDKDAILSKLNN